MSSSSSTQNNNHHRFPAATSAPPPTPNFISTSDSSSTDLLSRLLHRLPPSLSTTTPSLLRRRSSLATTTSPPILSFSDLTTTLTSSFPSVSQLGYFQLTNHPIPSQLARSAESDSLSIFNLSREKKTKHFSRPWPLGFDENDEDDTNVTESVFLDSSCLTGLHELNLSSLREFSCEMEKIGLTVVEALTCALGLRSPGIDDPDSVCSLMWISDGSVGSGKFYPYVVGLHYQIGNKNCSLLTDSGSVSVSSQMDSILVTFGDIAQVWSNGKLKKVRGKPTFSMEEASDSSSLSMSLLMTLPLESTVSPLLPKAVISNHGDTDQEEERRKYVHFIFV